MTLTCQACHRQNFDSSEMMHSCAAEALKKGSEGIPPREKEGERVLILLKLKEVKSAIGVQDIGKKGFSK